MGWFVMGRNVMGVTFRCKTLCPGTAVFACPAYVARGITAAIGG